MIKRIRGLDESIIEKNPLIRKYFEGFESEIFRGIGTLAILNVIKESGEQGIYGYLLLKKIKENSNNMLIIEEGTLYPLLRKLENWGSRKSEKLHLIHAIKQNVNGRIRKYYHLTPDGEIVVSYLQGFFSRLLYSSTDMLGLNIVEKKGKKTVFCPNCANKIAESSNLSTNCNICGHTITLKQRN